MLATTEYGTARSDRPPLLIAHGLYGSARNWGVIAKRLSDSRHVVAVDMRNHGASAWTESHGYPELAQDLAEVIEAHGGRADVIGHSMGGKAAMVLASSRAPLVNRLIVADIAPVAYEHSQIQFADAMRGLDLRGIDSRGEADRRLADTVPDKGIRAFLLQSLDIAEGRWRLNLDVLSRDMAQIVGFVPLDTPFDGPALFLSGAASDYVTAANRPEIRRLFPKARFVKIPGAGHWLHAEKPREFEAAVRVFLDA